MAAALPRRDGAAAPPRLPGHQVAVPSTGPAVADLIHGATNNPMAKYEMGAAGATIEREVVRWMLEKVGFDRHVGGGVLTHGGSLANLTALLAARARAAPDAWRHGVPGDLALLAPPSVHYSVRRAAAILGLGEDAVVELDVDELERIRPDALAAGLDRCAAAGRRPIALVAVAPATSTGLHDDLSGIGAFCAEHGIWLHVDAAHGGSALLSEHHRHGARRPGQLGRERRAARSGSLATPPASGHPRPTWQSKPTFSSIQRTTSRSMVRPGRAHLVLRHRVVGCPVDHVRHGGPHQGTRRLALQGAGWCSSIDASR